MYLRAKRCLDVFGAGVLLLVFGPVLLVGMLAVLVSSEGPVFFRQQRVGLHSSRFTILKLRTMRVELDPELCHERITPVGRLLRPLRIDELPQLINVLKGEMSLVGPRPLICDDSALCQTAAYWQRLVVRPGITGLARVKHPNASHGSTMLGLDLRYIDHLSPWLDLVILVWTPIAVFKGILVRPRKSVRRPAPAPAEEAPTAR
jgi:sugar transferase EpsL